MIDLLEKDGWLRNREGGYALNVGPYELSHDGPSKSRRIDYFWSVERPWRVKSRNDGYSEEGRMVVALGVLHTWQGARRAAIRAVFKHLEAEQKILQAGATDLVLLRAKPQRCVQCGEWVEPDRRHYANPTCRKCLPEATVTRIALNAGKV